MIETLRSENNEDGLDLVLEPTREEVLKALLADIAAADVADQRAIIDRYEETYPAAMAWAFGEVVVCVERGRQRPSRIPEKEVARKGVSPWVGPGACDI